jgi:hypothetical protein
MCRRGQAGPTSGRTDDARARYKCQRCELHNSTGAHRTRRPREPRGRTIVAEAAGIVLADALLCVRVVVEALVAGRAVAKLEQPVAVGHPPEVELVQELALVALERGGDEGAMNACLCQPGCVGGGRPTRPPTGRRSRRTFLQSPRSQCLQTVLSRSRSRGWLGIGLGPLKLASAGSVCLSGQRAAPSGHPSGARLSRQIWRSASSLRARSCFACCSTRSGEDEKERPGRIRSSTCGGRSEVATMRANEEADGGRVGGRRERASEPEGRRPRALGAETKLGRAASSSSRPRGKPTSTSLATQALCAPLLSLSFPFRSRRHSRACSVTLQTFLERAMSTTAADNPPSFGALSDLLDEQPHAFALSGGSDALRQASEQALKDVFQIGRSLVLLLAFDWFMGRAAQEAFAERDPCARRGLTFPTFRVPTRPTALDSEPTSLPPLESFLRELVAQNPSSSADDPLPSLPPTPLDALYTADLGPEQVWEQLELRATKLVDVLGQFGILADLDEADDDAGGGLSREEKIARGIALDSDEEDEDDEELSDGAFDGIDDMSDSEASGSDDDDNDDDDDESPLSDPDAFDDSAFPSADEEEDDFAGLDYGDEQASGADDVSDEEDDEEDDTHRRITDLDAPGSKRDARRCALSRSRAGLYRSAAATAADPFTRCPACDPAAHPIFDLVHQLLSASCPCPSATNLGRIRRLTTPSSRSTPSTARQRSSKRSTSPLARSAPTSLPQKPTMTTTRQALRCPLPTAWTTTMTKATTKTTLRSS